MQIVYFKKMSFNVIYYSLHANYQYSEVGVLGERIVFRRVGDPGLANVFSFEYLF